MDTTQPLTLLGNLSPQQFMQRHWQKKPLLIRQALPGLKPLLSRAELFELAGRDEVESRLVQRLPQRQPAPKSRPGKAVDKVPVWSMKQGPFPRRALPGLGVSNWTLLVQGVDLHSAAIRSLMDRFRFVPDARLDDVMVSFATDGGGVGPHFDSYDVFLLQAAGTRRWTIGKQKNLDLVEGAPLKILQNFEPQQSFDLEPGDMLYLPPRYAHDGMAVGECMTYSIGFRAPRQGELAQELLQRLSDEAGSRDKLYRDAKQPAVANAAEIPNALLEFAFEAVQKSLDNPLALVQVLGEHLTEPKAQVWFEALQEPVATLRAVATMHLHLNLHQRSRMLYAGGHIFINGESFEASGCDLGLMQQLANQRQLAPADVRRLSAGAQELLLDWLNNGWLHA